MSIIDWLDQHTVVTTVFLAAAMIITLTVLLVGEWLKRRARR